MGNGREVREHAATGIRFVYAGQLERGNRELGASGAFDDIDTYRCSRCHALVVEGESDGAHAEEHARVDRRRRRDVARLGERAGGTAVVSEVTGQYGLTGICEWCGARPNGEHAPDCRPPVYGSHMTGRPDAFADVYAALRRARPLIETWEFDGLLFVLDRLSVLSRHDARRIGHADEPWAACGVTRGLR